MTPIRTAVVGVGVQGQRHAGKLAELPESDLVSVVDLDVSRARAVGESLGVAASGNYRDLIGDVSAAIIATPTSTHHDIAGCLLENGIHVLIEKPLTSTLAEGEALVGLAESRSLVFQVGHLERFNPAVVGLAGHLREPQFVESNRIAPFKPRSLDVSVVLDLMIHDIDLILSFVDSDVEHVDAVGRSVFSDNIDVANARIRFANGCVANVTSSRISMKTERSLRIFQEDSYLSADLQAKSLSSYRKRGKGPVAGPDDVIVDKRSFDDSDAMLEQARAFLASVAGGPPPLVSGRTAIRALATAMRIAELVGESAAA